MGGNYQFNDPWINNTFQMAEKYEIFVTLEIIEWHGNMKFI